MRETVATFWLCPCPCPREAEAEEAEEEAEEEALILVFMRLGSTMRGDSNSASAVEKSVCNVSRLVTPDPPPPPPTLLPVDAADAAAVEADDDPLTRGLMHACPGAIKSSKFDRKTDIVTYNCDARE